MSNEVLVDWHVLEPKERMQLALNATGPFFITGEDNLQLSGIASTTNTSLLITGRFMQLNGEVTSFQHSYFLNSNRTLTSIVRAFGNGWILNLTVTAATGTPLIGQCWARVQVVRGLEASGVVLSTLVSGYVTAVQPIAFPGGKVRGTLDGPGVIRSITGTNPAAGAEISETVPVGARWRLISLQATLVTDANAANRLPRLLLDDGTTVFGTFPLGVSETASLTWTNTWAAGRNVFADATASVAGPIPTDSRLLAGYRIRTNTNNLQAGDDWGAPQLLVEEWLEGA